MPKQLTPKPQGQLEKLIEKETESEIVEASSEQEPLEEIAEVPEEQTCPGRKRHKSRSSKNNVSLKQIIS